MRLRFVNVANLEAMIPRWAVSPYLLAKSVEDFFQSPSGQLLLPRGKDIYGALPLRLEFDARKPGARVSGRQVGQDELGGGFLAVSCRSLMHEAATIEIPINWALNGYGGDGGGHLIYMHALQTQVPLAYVGVTCQRWYERFEDHAKQAAAQSPYPLHVALRAHPGVPLLHRVLAVDLSYTQALELEEEWVENLSLYPLGLNIVQGGKAGIRHLGGLGYQATSVHERDQCVQRLLQLEMVRGRQNPLYAAALTRSEGFAHRVLNGSGGYLAAREVRTVTRGAAPVAHLLNAQPDDAVVDLNGVGRRLGNIVTKWLGL